MTPRMKTATLLNLRVLKLNFTRDNQTITALGVGQGGERTAIFDIRKIGQFRKTLRRRDELAVEATGNIAWFAEQISDRVSRVVVVDPHHRAGMIYALFGKLSDRPADKAATLPLDKITGFHPAA